MSQTNQIVLKYKQLYPNKLTISCQQQFSLKIAHSNDSCMSQISTSKKQYYFMIEQRDQQIGPLCEGDQHVFCAIQTPGTYSLICSNYPKLTASLQIINYDLSKLTPSKMVSEHLQQVQEVKQQQREEEKQENADHDFNFQNSEFESPSAKSLQSRQLQASLRESIYTPSQKTDYDLVLDEETESLNHRYLRYFRQQFKLWRDFFETGNQNKRQSLNQRTPTKQNKDQKSPQEFAISSLKKEKSEDYVSNSIRPSSAMSNYKIPSISNDKSVDSHMYSHQGLLERNEEMLCGSQTRGMKKTNSQYLQTIQRSQQKQVVKTQTQTESIIDWGLTWALQNEEKQIFIPRKNDHGLINQYLAFLHNRFQISRFLHS